jgi:hypothetical protein
MRILVSLVPLVVLGGAACGRSPDRPADTAAPSIPAANVPSLPDADPAPAPAPVVTERGIGPLQAGMSLKEASAAVGTTLSVPRGSDPASCYYVAWPDAPRGVRVMADAGRIARIDVDSAGVATAAGVRVGDGEERVQQLYAGRVEESPHKYIEGHYLTVTPASPADSAFRIVFEIAKGRIVRYRAGRLPPVEWVEGCG